MSVLATDDAAAFATALDAIGIACVVEPRAGLAILKACRDSRALIAASVRRDVLALARDHGFTHVAVELHVGMADTGAPVLRD
jgi:hypothetical protein